MFCVSCGSGGGGGAEPAAVAAGGSQGVELEVTEGPLTGVKVSIPAGAASTAFELTVARALATAQPGFEIVGPAVTLGPVSLNLQAQGRISLPYLSGQPSVLWRRPDGEVVEVGPVTQDFANQRIEFDAMSLGTYWPASRYFNGVRTFFYLPMGNGDVWDFDNGMTAQMTRTTSEPRLEGTTVQKLEFAADGELFGLYLRGTGFGPTDLLGFYTQGASGSQQQLHPATVFFPGAVTLGLPVTGEFPFSRFQPLAASLPSAVGRGDVAAVVTHRADVETPAQTFEDILELSVVMQSRDAGGAAQARTITLWLARNVGLVGVSMQGSVGWLRAATVGGQTYGS